MNDVDAKVGVVVIGARGRMGQALIEAIDRDDRCSLAAAIDRGDALPDRGDLVIDFSSDEGAKTALATSERLSAPLLVGTTALSEATLMALRQASERRSVMVTSNASVGVAVMHRMVQLAVRALGPRWSIRLSETHHTRKLDAPSGTALALADTIREAGGTMRRDDIRSTREGDVVGHHRIELIGPGETLVLEHAAHDRALFARGALQLGLWLRGAGPGWHSVQAWLDDALAQGARP
jgi:4-hydroxy-tetrahydrodipicolinate reductase